MAYFAQVDVDGTVIRVVVCESAAWLEQRLGGTWIETKMADPAEAYAGIGYKHSEVATPKFCRDWRQPEGAHDAYPVGTWVWHNGMVWENLTAANVWEPGVSGWRDPLNEWPDWVQPTGAHDAYPLNAKVTFNGQRWINTGSAANVWQPGVFGWTVQP